MSVAAAFTLASRSTAADGSYFYIVNSSTRMIAEVFAHRTDDGSPVVLGPHYGGTSQQFTVQRLPLNHLQPKEEQWFLLRARHSDKCLKTAGYQSGAPGVQAGCGGDASQMSRVRTVAKSPAECANPNQCFGGQRHVLGNYYDRDDDAWMRRTGDSPRRRRKVPDCRPGTVFPDSAHPTRSTRSGSW